MDIHFFVLGSGKGATCGKKITGMNATPYVTNVTCKKCLAMLEIDRKQDWVERDKWVIEKPILDKMGTVSTVQKNQQKILDYIERGFRVLGIESRGE